VVVQLLFAQQPDEAEPYNTSPYLQDAPPQPGEDSWTFIEALKSPIWKRQDWSMAAAGSDYADLTAGIQLKTTFRDPKKRLVTAYDDLLNFLEAGGVSRKNGQYTIETVMVPGLGEEEFQLEINKKGGRILATDLEGIRRGIFHVEDLMLAQHGAFLPLGNSQQRSFIRRRISRCAFGPIKRLPKLRDELMDDVDYYPDNYLNRLAHEGVNGLWLTAEFRDLCATSFTPYAGKNSEKRLAKLRSTVQKCLRYGIRTYIFCIEPHAWDSSEPVLKKFPELAGAPSGKQLSFCPNSETASQYLYQSVNTIFKAVPDLGGLIDITLGERTTTCLSTYSVSDNVNEQPPVNCPHCSKKAPWEILYASLSAMEKGMHAAAPNAELVSWLYMSDPIDGKVPQHDLGDWVYELPAHTPKGVILQVNFESGVHRMEFGKELIGGDYWLSTPGPSSRFERLSSIARINQTAISSKIQSSTSHETATVPYVPVPSLLYQKFASMRRLGVSHTMLSWYFGNYPGLMNKACGLLSFEPFPDEDQFLHQLAALYWKKEDVSKVVEAWKAFSDGYQQYPIINLFQYLGPMHDGPVWPLLLKPVDASLSRTWEISSVTTLKPLPPSGDRVGECIGDALTLNETVELCRRMSEGWDRGLAILNTLESNYKNEPDRLMDIGVAQALGIQFRSGYNILHFYDLREKLLSGIDSARASTLTSMSGIINDELIQDERLLHLCEKDSRLGFHAEAEGYKYYPARIRWRMQQLQAVLHTDVPELQQQIAGNKELFPAFTGRSPQGAIAHAVQVNNGFGILWANAEINPPANLEWQSCAYGEKQSGLRWSSCYDADSLYVVISDEPKSSPRTFSSILVKIEPQRLWPAKHFVFTSHPPDHGDPQLYEINHADSKMIVMRIALKDIGLDKYHLHPIRMDVRVSRSGEPVHGWRPDHPTQNGWPLVPDNPADLGWLLFKQ